jgi:hypothetical protein
MFIFQLAQEAYACEEKEEKLVTDAVKHLTEANYQIKDLYDQFTVKVGNPRDLQYQPQFFAVLEILHIRPLKIKNPTLISDTRFCFRH